MHWRRVPRSIPGIVCKSPLQNTISTFRGKRFTHGCAPLINIPGSHKLRKLQMKFGVTMNTIKYMYVLCTPPITATSTMFRYAVCSVHAMTRRAKKKRYSYRLRYSDYSTEIECRNVVYCVTICNIMQKNKMHQCTFNAK